MTIVRTTKKPEPVNFPEKPYKLITSTAPKIQGRLFSSKGENTTRIHFNGVRNFHSCDFSAKQKKDLRGLDHFKFAPLKGDTQIYVNISSVAKRLGISRQEAKYLITEKGLDFGGIKGKVNERHSLFTQGCYDLCSKIMQPNKKDFETWIRHEWNKIPLLEQNKICRQAHHYAMWIKDHKPRDMSLDEQVLRYLCLAVAIGDYTMTIPPGISSEHTDLIMNFIKPSTESFKLVKQEMTEAARNGKKEPDKQFLSIILEAAKFNPQVNGISIFNKDFESKYRTLFTNHIDSKFSEKEREEISALAHAYKQPLTELYKKGRETTKSDIQEDESDYLDLVAMSIVLREKGKPLANENTDKHVVNLDKTAQILIDLGFKGLNDAEQSKLDLLA